MKTKLKKIIDILLDIIYPKKCIFCEEVIPILQEDNVCKRCYMDIDFIDYDKMPFLHLFEYNEKTKFAIYRLKYYDKSSYAIEFAKMMYNKFSKLSVIDEYDLVVYVPMYLRKKKTRGYDQAELLALHFSKLAGIPISQNNLIRTRNTIAQSKVSFEERKSNVEAAFSVQNREEFLNKSVILIDDIFTTGSTMFECASALKKAGACNICFYTLAKVIKIY